MPTIAVAWCVGTEFGLRTGPEARGWILGIPLVAVIAFLLRERIPCASSVLLVVAVVILGMVRSSNYMTVQSPTRHQLLGMADGRIVGATGTLDEAPQESMRSHGVLEKHGHVGTSTIMQLIDWEVRDSTTPPLSDQGLLIIRIMNCEHEEVAFAKGDRLSIRGRLKRTGTPRNPGEARGVQEFWIEVPSVGLVRTTNTENRGGEGLLDGVGGAWRLAASGAMEESLSGSGNEATRELAKAVVLGIRSDDFDRMSEPYRRTGLAHYLAVSGFAFGVLIAVPAFLMGTQRPAVMGSVMVMVVILGLGAIDIRAPALRAGVVSLIAFLGIAIGRDWNRASLLSLACVLILLIDPNEIRRPGFQLSFAVVSSLLVLSSTLERRMPFHHAPLGGRISQLTWRPLRTLVSCGVVSWLSATPIVMHHFGIISPYGVVISILAAPLVTGIVATGVASIFLQLMLPMAGCVAGFLCNWSAWSLDMLANTASELPGACHVTPMVSWPWAVACELVIWRWIMHGGPRERTILTCASLVLVATPFLNIQKGLPHSAVRMVTLDVGDGTCHVVTGPSGSVIIDGGSTTRSSCAQRIIIPALRALGIHRLDTVVVTHANLDHFAALGDLFSRIPVERMVIGRSFTQEARSRPDGPAAELLELADRWSVPVLTVERGAVLDLVGLRWRFIHPDPDVEWSTENDSSLVIRVESPGSSEQQPAQILFTGDIEEQAMSALLEGDTSMIRSRILEAPHHGSIRPSSRAFIEAVSPDVIVQSSGRRRLRVDALGKHVGDRLRVATALSGAIRLDIVPGQPVSIREFIDGEGRVPEWTP
jgi:competence protein ComEC